MITTPMHFDSNEPAERGAGGAGGKGDTAGSATEQALQPDAPPRPADAPVRRPRGFAAMDRKLVSELARKGGKAAHSAGTAHEFTPEEAREAGRKGGQAAHARRKGARPAAEAAGGAAPQGQEGRGGDGSS